MQPSSLNSRKTQVRSEDNVYKLITALIKPTKEVINKLPPHAGEVIYMIFNKCTGSTGKLLKSQ